MFWSKIWLFLIALVAAGTLTVALALPRSAHKSRVADERQRLVVACDVVNILLERKAITDVEIAGNFAREAGIVSGVDATAAAKDLDGSKSPSKDLTETARALMKQVKGSQPTYAIITDAAGRVLARAGLDEGQVGDYLSGLPLVDDALVGYMRDDTWVTEQNGLFLVAASPVVSRGVPNKIIGAAVLGWKLDKDLADGFVKAFRASKPVAEGEDPAAAPVKDGEDRSIHVAFYAGGKEVTKSGTSTTLESGDVLAQYARADKTSAVSSDCRTIAPFYAQQADDPYAVVMSRLPGASEQADAFFIAFTPRPIQASFGGAVGQATGELGGGFPWFIVIGLFVLGFGGGVALTILESDRPLRRLQADTVRLAKAEVDRLAEDKHAGRFGSIARSVNIQIDKLARDAKAAKKDLDGLLGPAPEGSLGAMDLLGGPPAPSRISSPGASLGGLSLAAPPPSAPPPSEFRFGDSGSTPSKPATAAPELDLGPSRSTPKPAAPPPPRPQTPPVGRPTVPKPPVPTKKLEDDILSFGDDASGEAPPAAAPPVSAAGKAEEDYFREIFEQFLELKRKCGEPTSGLTFAKFGDKLRKNRSDLMSKTGCTEVRFTVYVKDGKAALKATPVKEG